jgi:hypothetical protein
MMKVRLEKVKVRTAKHEMEVGHMRVCSNMETLPSIAGICAGERVEPPPPAFSELTHPVSPATSMVAVGLPNTGKDGKSTAETLAPPKNHA